MLIIPAIDLKDGKCVRLKQGRMEDDTVFSDDPAATAQILAWFRGLQQHYGYSDLQLLDAAGAVRLSLSGNNEALAPK